MSYNVRVIPPFEKQFKRLAKKFPSLKAELGDLIRQLEVAPNTGVSIGHNCYKIRLAIASKGKGKSGGARIITCLVVSNLEVHLLYIYDKSDQADISDNDLLELLEWVE
jgi:hypothetical protein